MKKIAVISDTHGLLRNEVAEIIKGCDVIFHLGDIDNREVLDRLNQLGKVYGFNFYLVHDKSMTSAENSKKADIILYGHSHKYEKYEMGLKIYCNPGSCGVERFRLPVTMAVICIDERVKEIRIDRIDIPGRRERGQDFKVSATKISEELVKQICRIYVTHPGVDADGIMDKLEVSALYQ